MSKIYQVLLEQNRKLKSIHSQLDILEAQLATFSDLWKTLRLAPARRSGANSPASGAAYEKQVWKVCKQLYWDDHPFCVASAKELGGSTADHDLICWLGADKAIPIEIKKKATPDWMQFVINREMLENNYECDSSRHKIPAESAQLYVNILRKHGQLFGGELPPFLVSPMKHSEWVSLKKSCSTFKDLYIECDDDQLIAKLYASKGTAYIQVSDFGLYHTGEDIAGFGVPMFKCATRIRIRVKIHTTRNARGFMNASVTCSAQPDIQKISASPFTLDNTSCVPAILSN